MKQKIYFITFFVVAALMLFSCDIEDKFQGEIDELYSQIDSLSESNRHIMMQIDSLNSSLSKLQTIVSAVQQGVYIKSVLPLSENGEQLGYLITFSDGNSISIYNGKDGKDGYTPALGVREGDDGAYYWTRDGEFLLDDAGNKVRADGALPRFDVRDGNWYVSFDSGATWKEMGPAVGDDGQPGESGDRFFKDVNYTPGNNVVVFTLADGTVISVPCYQAISISFNAYDNVTGIMAGETIKVAYTLSYGDDKTVVTASSDGNYIVNVKKESNTSGTILITCPGLYMDGHVNVMAYDGIGYASIAVITFYEKKMTFDAGLNYDIPTQGGTVEIPFHYNFDYFVEVEQGAESWLEVVQTKASVLSGKLVFNVAKNDGDERTGRIFIFPENTTGQPYATITVNQDAAYFDMEKRSLVFGSKGQTIGTTIYSSREIELSVPYDAASWLSCSLTEVGSDVYSVSMTASENVSPAKRAASVQVLAKSNGSPLGVIEVIQLASNGDDEMDMVFRVQINVSNDFTAYLPIRRDDGANYFVVDWGDGSYERVSPDDNRTNGGNMLFHKYSGVSGSGASFLVRISGSLNRLYYNHVPEGYRSCISEVVQWGHTGLTSMDYAFYGATRLEKLPADETLAFGDVRSFEHAFSNCPRLSDISPHLFDYASVATDFYSVFYNCESLTRIPAGLFDGCISATSFSFAFGDCKNLVSVPDKLFSNCRYVKSFSDLFYQCYSLETLPANLFRNCGIVENFNYLCYYCRHLTSIPKDLFKDNVSAQSFYFCFYNCALTSIPEGLFDNCPLASNFSYTFAYNYDLKRVPVNLFDNNIKVSDFSRCFFNCHQLQGESPYSLVNGKKVHLYERPLYPDYFVTPSRTEYCFNGDYGLTDYESIPSSWVNNY